MKFLPPESYEWGAEALALALKPVALFRASLDRIQRSSLDTDEYVITVESTDAGNHAPRKPSTQDLAPLLPSGSQWRQASGWRSFFSCSFKLDGAVLWAVGIDSVKAHPTRGCYPVSTIFLCRPQDDLAAAFERVAGELKQAAQSTQYTLTDVAETVPSYGLVTTNAASPIDHIRYELAILGLAATAWRSGNHLAFRTLMLTDSFSLKEHRRALVVQGKPTEAERTGLVRRIRGMLGRGM